MTDKICKKEGLVEAVKEHMKLYDTIGAPIVFTLHEMPHGSVDVMGTRNDGKTLSLYSLACDCNPLFETKEFAEKKLYMLRDFIEEYMPHVERVNLIHVNDDHAYIIR